jgi:hypothetical protein
MVEAASACNGSPTSLAEQEQARSNWKSRRCLTAAIDITTELVLEPVGD